MQSAAALAPQYSGDHIGKRDFERLAKFIYAYSGIKMPPSKTTMLEGRLRRRLKATGIETFGDYCNYLFDGGGLDHEAVFLIDAVTTNKTDFFREPGHFKYMVDKVLPAIANAGTRNVRIWSAACSTGAEPYTVAMLLDEFVSERQGMNYEILATDLSTEVLEVARKGIYSLDMMAPVAAAYRKKYVMSSIRPGTGTVRIHPGLRSRVFFGRLNLMDKEYSIGKPVDMVFCRNVLIYFDRKTQNEVLTRLCRNLLPGGHLFIGHSESVSGLDLPIKQVANTVFRKV